MLRRIFHMDFNFPCWSYENSLIVIADTTVFVAKICFWKKPPIVNLVEKWSSTFQALIFVLEKKRCRLYFQRWIPYRLKYLSQLSRRGSSRVILTMGIVHKLWHGESTVSHAFRVSKVMWNHIFFRRARSLRMTHLFLRPRTQCFRLNFGPPLSNSPTLTHTATALCAREGEWTAWWNFS